MGMFNDGVSPKRTQWTYTYTGEEMLPYARKLFQEYDAKERAAREQMAKLMLDRTVSQSDDRIEKSKRDIQNYGTLKEQCEVFQWEFQRNPQKSYELGLGDITFFGLTTPLSR